MQVYSYRYGQYVTVLVDIFGNKHITNNQRLLALRLLHSACRVSQEYKEVAGRNCQLVSVSVTFRAAVRGRLSFISDSSKQKGLVANKIGLNVVHSSDIERLLLLG